MDAMTMMMMSLPKITSLSLFKMTTVLLLWFTQTWGFVQHPMIQRRSAIAFKRTERTTIKTRQLLSTLSSSPSSLSTSTVDDRFRLYSSNDPSIFSATDAVEQRTYHVLSDESDVLHPRRAFLEEITTFYTSSRNLEKTLIVKNQQRQELLRVPVPQARSMYLRPTAIAAMLYMVCDDASSPFSVLQNGHCLELDCELGLTALVSALTIQSLGQTNSQGDNTSAGETSRPSVQLPSGVQTLTLSANPRQYAECAEKMDANLNALFGNNYNKQAKRILMLQLDWTEHPKLQQDRIRPAQYQTILGCDLLQRQGLSSAASSTSSTTQQLARTVAHFLRPDGKFLHVSTSSASIGTAVNSAHGDGGRIAETLRSAYRMSVDERRVRVDSHTYAPQPIDPVTGKPLVRRQHESTSSLDCSCWIAGHCGDYNGYNGDYVWPIENGQYGGDGYTRMVEKDIGGPGPWYIQ